MGLWREQSLRSLIKGELRIKKKGREKHERAGSSEARCRGRPGAERAADPRGTASPPHPPTEPRIPGRAAGTGRGGTTGWVQRPESGGRGPTRVISPSHALPRRRVSGERSLARHRSRRVSLHSPVLGLITSDSPTSGLPALRPCVTERGPSPAPGHVPRDLGVRRGQQERAWGYRLGCTCAPAPPAAVRCRQGKRRGMLVSLYPQPGKEVIVSLGKEDR